MSAAGLDARCDQPPAKGRGKNKYEKPCGAVGWGGVGHKTNKNMPAHNTTTKTRRMRRAKGQESTMYCPCFCGSSKATELTAALRVVQTRKLPSCGGSVKTLAFFELPDGHEGRTSPTRSRVFDPQATLFPAGRLCE